MELQDQFGGSHPSSIVSIPNDLTDAQRDVLKRGGESFLKHLRNIGSPLGYIPMDRLVAAEPAAAEPAAAEEAAAEPVVEGAERLGGHFAAEMDPSGGGLFGVNLFANEPDPNEPDPDVVDGAQDEPEAEAPASDEDHGDFFRGIVDRGMGDH